MVSDTENTVSSNMWLYGTAAWPATTLQPHSRQREKAQRKRHRKQMRYVRNQARHNGKSLLQAEKALRTKWKRQEKASKTRV
jgi:hypothetical protein